MERRPVPADVGARFSVAQAKAAGIHPKRLDASDLSSPLRGMRATQAPATYADRARAALAVIPEEALFSHTTAARLMSVTLPRKAARWGHDGFVEHHADRAGTTWSNLPLAVAADTWVDLATLVGVPDLIVAGDFLLRAQLCTPEVLHSAVPDGDACPAGLRPVEVTGARGERRNPRCRGWLDRPGRLLVA